MYIAKNISELINLYGVDKLNTATKYPSILTLHQFEEGGRNRKKLTETHSMPDVGDHEWHAFEKIDGTNVRILRFGYQTVIGSRTELLHQIGDQFYNTSMGIVEHIRKLKIFGISDANMNIVYGELYGGKINSKSKNYGKDKLSFRVFDVAQLPSPHELLVKPIQDIAHGESIQ